MRRRERLAQKRDEADQRAVERAGRTDLDQLALLDQRTGAALKERTRLLGRIEKHQRGGKKDD